MTEEVESIYVARRVTDMPIPFVDCEKKKCSRCGEEVWVDKKTRVHWTKYPIICTVCIPEILEEKPGPHTIKVPREVRESLKAFLDAQRDHR